MLRLALIVSLLCVPAAGPAFSKPAKPVDFDQLQPWHAARIAEAGQGTRAIVRIPLVHRSIGWGCVCPNWYVGEGTDTNGAGAWIKPSFSKAAAGLPGKVGDDGIQVVAEGYYTGKTETSAWKSDGVVRDTYKMAGFHVLRWRMQREGEDPVMAVLLGGAKAQEAVQPLTDDRPWLVIAHSLQLSSPGCTKGAELRRKRLVEKGFKDAEVIDSRAAPLLACCFKSVLLGRFKTRAEARALSTSAKAKTVKTYVRRGW
jgi:hypothetical protein